MQATLLGMQFSEYLPSICRILDLIPKTANKQTFQNKGKVRLWKAFGKTFTHITTIFVTPTCVFLEHQCSKNLKWMKPLHKHTKQYNPKQPKVYNKGNWKRYTGHKSNDIILPCNELYVFLQSATGIKHSVLILILFQGN